MPVASALPRDGPRPPKGATTAAAPPGHRPARAPWTVGSADRRNNARCGRRSSPPQCRPGSAAASTATIFCSSASQSQRRLLRCDALSTPRGVPRCPGPRNGREVGTNEQALRKSVGCTSTRTEASALLSWRTGQQSTQKVLDPREIRTHAHTHTPHSSAADHPSKWRPLGIFSTEKKKTLQTHTT